MKIVIADDERLVRLSLRSMIEEMNFDNIAITECRNGMEAVEVIKNIQPEIALIDIRMPLLNGLEVIEQCLTSSERTKFIITTGFSEFEYAKKAIELGVCDYLLKPIDPEKLMKVIDKLIKGNEIRKQEDNNNFQSNMVKLCYDEALVNDEEFNKLYVNKCFTIAVYYFDSKQNYNELRLIKKKLLNYVSFEINELVKDNINIATLNTSDNSVAYIFLHSSENNLRVKLYIKRIMEKYSSHNNDVIVTSIVGEELTIFNGVLNTIEEIKRYSALRIISGTNRNYFLKELKSNENFDKYCAILEVINSLSESYKNNIVTKFYDSIDKLERTINYDKSLFLDKEIFRNINHFLKINISFEYGGGFSSEWLELLCKYKNNLLKSFNKNKNITEKIMEFINNNYMYEISIATISETFNLTPNYISSLFHKRTNMKLIDYLAKVRINKAQQLLAETDLNIGEICEAVGYHSSRYFTTLFKKITNASPYEYRKRLYDKQSINIDSRNYNKTP